MNSLSKIISIIIAVILMFIFPIEYMAIKQDMLHQIYVTAQTTYIVDCTLNLGYLTKQMYEEYLKNLNLTGNIYDINITYYKYNINNLSDTNEDYSENYYGIYSEDVKEVIYSDGEYRFVKGDFLSFQVKNLNKTFATKIQELLFGRTLPTEQIVTTYGGMIKDEAY